MAQFKGRKQAAMRKEDEAVASGFEAMGKPVPYFRRQAAMDHCRAMGLTDTNKAMATIDRMAEAISRDDPYEAMEAGNAHLDLTGTYRLMAVLCTAQPPRVR